MFGPRTLALKWNFGSYKLSLLGKVWLFKTLFWLQVTARTITSIKNFLEYNRKAKYISSATLVNYLANVKLCFSVIFQGHFGRVWGCSSSNPLCENDKLCLDISPSLCIRCRAQRDNIRSRTTHSKGTEYDITKYQTFITKYGMVCPFKRTFVNIRGTAYNIL